MPFFTYRTTDGLVDRIFRTQAEADARAVTETTVTAHTASVKLPEFAAPGVGHFISNEIVREAPLSFLEALKGEMWRTHRYMGSLWVALRAEAIAHTSAEYVNVHDYFASLHKANYHIVKDNPADLSFIHRIVFAQNLREGPQDGSGNLLEIPALFDACAAASPGVISATTYVNPTATTLTAAAHWTIAASLSSAHRSTALLSTAGSISNKQLASGAWIDALT